MKVLIVGMGIAGLTAAITSSEQGDEVTLIVKTQAPFLSASAWAQGGIVYKGLADSPELLMKDIRAAATGMTRQSLLELLAKRGPQFIEDFFIKKLRVPFVQKPSVSASDQQVGVYALTREAGHSCARILYSGDKTGEVVIKYLYAYMCEHCNVKILFEHLALDLINIPHHSVEPMDVYESTHCVGLYVYAKQNNEVLSLLADKIILATGGIGALYQHSTNPPTATGDGIAIAQRAGARIVNMEFTQFHPTALALKKANNFLISEALRGEGAVLINDAGEDFTLAQDARGSLTPRDKLSRMIINEQLRTQEEHVYLSFADCRFNLAERFPRIYAKCRELGLELSHQRLPVTPAFHFCCGGILSDKNAVTSVARLYAAGECACTGVHGANRLASTSLLEAAYFAHRAALHRPSQRAAVAAKNIRSWQFAKHPSVIDAVVLYQDFKTLRSLMWNYVGVIRKEHRLTRGLKELMILKERVDDYYRKSLPQQDIVELRNATQTAILVTEAALKNKESVGSHYRDN